MAEQDSQEVKLVQVEAAEQAELVQLQLHLLEELDQTLIQLGQQQLHLELVDIMQEAVEAAVALVLELEALEEEELDKTEELVHQEQQILAAEAAEMAMVLQEVLVDQVLLY